MREIRTSGLMSGDGKRGGASASVLALVLDSTETNSTIIENGARRVFHRPLFYSHFASALQGVLRVHTGIKSNGKASAFVAARCKTTLRNASGMRLDLKLYVNRF
jgi:hypothetical protein